MDSFYDQPRKPPMSSGRANFNQHTMVPDVSMLAQNTGKYQQKHSEMSYNTWKYQLQTKCAKQQLSKENLQPSKESLYRKQVRFEMQASQTNTAHVPRYNALPVRPSIIQRGTQQDVHKPSAVQSEKPELPRHRINCNILQAKPFEKKMFIENVPNRSLDLSVIEPHTPQVNCKTPARLWRSRKDSFAESTTVMKSVVETKTVNNNAETAIATNSEPSVKDLLQIIQQQNQQLITLQQQVTTLMQERNQPCMPAASAPFKNKHFENLFTGPACSSAYPRENKFAIDVMTSFEVSIRGPNTLKQPKATITEILDETQKTSKGKIDLSLTLNDPVIVDERCPSPENSIHVDMVDYSSDDDDEAKSDIGWTIYNNVMQQVNCMLAKCGDSDLESPKKHDVPIGKYTPTEVSFAVQQLLMKYLPDDKLAQVVNVKQQKPQVISHPKKHELVNSQPHLIKRRADFSMATVQYMQKYNLLNTDSKTPSQQTTAKNSQPGPPTSEKMLDVTALKKQPKLL